MLNSLEDRPFLNKLLSHYANQVRDITPFMVRLPLNVASGSRKPVPLDQALDIIFDLLSSVSFVLEFALVLRTDCEQDHALVKPSAYSMMHLPHRLVSTCCDVKPQLVTLPNDTT